MPHAPLLTAAHLGRVLQSARKARGLTQSELAARVGISQARLSALERQPGTLSVDQLLALCAHLGLELLVDAKDAANTRAADW